MSAYLNDFIVTIVPISDKKMQRPLREFSKEGIRTVNLQFDSEYKIVIKNKTKSRALVKVFIDGMDIFSNNQSLIINAGQTIDVERFVDNLKEGKRFKFASLEESIKEGLVTDPTSLENGTVRVEFYKEKNLTTEEFFEEVERFKRQMEELERNKLPKPKGPPNNIDWLWRKPEKSWDEQYWWQTPQVTCETCAVGTTATSDTVMVQNCCVQYTTAGITLEGGTSFQSFCESTENFKVEEVPSVIEIRIEGCHKESSKKISIQEENFRAFKKILPELMMDPLKRGKFVVVYDKKITHMMDTFESALKVALTCFKEGEFNIQQIIDL